MKSQPIAIVGRACVLPGVHSPEELWRAVLDRRDLTSAAPEGYWQLDHAGVRTPSVDDAANRTWSDMGGYVSGFDGIFNPDGFAVPADQIAGLDPIFKWTLHGVREALAPLNPSDAQRAATGLILGNLNYPNGSMTRFAETVWLNQMGGEFAAARAAQFGLETDPRNRFCSGYPAQFAAAAMNLGGPAFTLDAACASSLYAIKLACDRLQDGRADVMVAGAVNRADDLFIHVGFCALNAMSKTGRSKPFDRSADGLVPAEGAAFVALKRLDDAVRNGDRILGVIRGVGLSNDGRSGGLLSPAVAGQERALRAAYAAADLDPASISLLECHATGTPVGDGVEIESGSRIFHQNELPIGSLKSNMGHLITVAGAAGLLKVLSAMEAGVRPPTINLETPIDLLGKSPFRPLTEAEDWVCDGPKRAGVNAFGFGGNNAHLIVESFDGQHQPASFSGVDAAAPKVAVVAWRVSAGAAADNESFAAQLAAGTPSCGAESIDIAVKGLKFPPKDLQQTLPQQLLIMELAREAAAAVNQLPPERTGVYIGMGADPNIARYSARWRLDDWAKNWTAQGYEIDEAWLEQAREAFTPGLEAAGVVGTMPNIPANRINAQLDLKGPGFTISAEELSGFQSLELAERALRAGEIDAALVGAVDLSHEPVHAAALAAIPQLANTQPGDAAVVLVLKRHEDAVRDGDQVYAVLGGDQATEPAPETQSVFGRAHTAGGLVDMAAALAGFQAHQRFTPDGPVPLLTKERRVVQLEQTGFAGKSASVVLSQGSAVNQSALDMPAVHVFAGHSTADVLAALQSNQPSSDGPMRLTFLARDEAEGDKRRAFAVRYLSGQPKSGFTAIAPEMFWCDQPLEGDMGFVFNGAAAAYAGNGHELVKAMPQLLERAVSKFPKLAECAHWLEEDAFVGPEGRRDPSPAEVLHGSVILSQLHGILSREVLGLKPDAVLGISSGETNSMFVSGAWTDLDGLFNDIHSSEMYTKHIAGEYDIAKRAWASHGVTEIDWAGWRFIAPVSEVQAAVADEPLVHLTMVNAPEDCVIGGQADGCRRVVARLEGFTAVSLGHDIIAHAPEMAVWEQPWRTIHTRETHAVPGIRFYSNAFRGRYEPTQDNIAQALTGQATGSVDFRPVVEAAWADGVRIFVEHGPRDLCAGWIKQILGDKPHLTVSLDRAGRGLDQLAVAIAQLQAAGVAVNPLQATPQSVKGAQLRFPAHAPPVALPALKKSYSGSLMNSTKNAMPSAPELPEALPEGRLSLQPQASQAPAPAIEQTSIEATPVVQPAAQPGVPFSPVQPAGDANPVIGGMRHFHASISQAHQSFLELQERNLDRMLKMRSMMAQGMPVAQPQPVAQAPQPAPAPQPPVVQAPQPSPVVSAPTPVQPVQKAPDPKPAAPVKPVAAAPAPKPQIAKPVTQAASAVDSGPAYDVNNLPGPKISREGLEVLASGKISEVLGPLFEQQDHHPRQVRMPEPPLLLADRVIGIDAEPGSMARQASIWTETDVHEEAWYLDRGHMPAGIMIESGQADLLLISYLGVDFENRGERIYRLLGCDLTFKGGLPTAGDTLRYDIHIDGYAEHGPVRLFFFHYDCRINDQVRLSVSNGQAGFFTDEELDESGGILWNPYEEGPDSEPHLDPPAIAIPAQSFSHDQVTAYFEGRMADCFGPEFAMVGPHTCTPKSLSGRLAFFDEVTDFDPAGGPWKRGYLKALSRLEDDEWFFDGHFKNDPCMPGTLMFEGCFQTMAFYLSAMGYTVDRDGWRFEPVPDETFKLRCRGQVTPGAKLLEYEVFVEEVHEGPVPMLYAHVLCTVDGLKAFHGTRLALRLIPSYPLDNGWRLEAEADRGRSASVDGFTFDYKSLAACAWGKPSEAFGPSFAVFDGIRRCPRLPGPPYHFMSRVTGLDSPMGVMKAGGTIEVEYDIPVDAWYFSENGNRTMPYAVLLEAALQPCGWFASYMGCALTSPTDLKFRNLDGTATQHFEITPEHGMMTTRVKSTSVSQAGPIIIVGYEVVCTIGDETVFDMTTVFGFFSPESLGDQAGLPTTDAMRDQLKQPANLNLDLRPRQPRYFDEELHMPGPMLMMLDRITHFDPQGGKSGLGRMVGEVDVDHGQWFFKSHFYEDPVQPGSLGIEAMLQLLQFYMLHTGMHQGIENPRFEAISTGVPMSWKYRGQVTPEKHKVTVELDVVEQKNADGQAEIVTESSLWVDGLRIYEATSMGMRIVSDVVGAVAACDEVLDPEKDLWLNDHAPTWTVPALAMMSMVDRLAAAALARTPGRRVAAVENVQVHRWLSFDQGARHLKAAGEPVGHDRVRTKLSVWNPETNRYQAVASGDVILSDSRPLAKYRLNPPADADAVDNPYEDGSLFHGPAYQALKSLKMGATGSSSILDADPGSVPLGVLNQRLLDAATHGIPHDNLSQWSDRIPAGMVAYPKSLTRAVFSGPTPTSGDVRCEARLVGFENDNSSFPIFRVQLLHQERVWADFELVEVLFPKGPLGEAPKQQRRAFLADRAAGLALSSKEGAATVLADKDLRASDWLEGTMSRVYGVTAASFEDKARQIAIKEHVAGLEGVHPFRVRLDADDGAASEARPFNRHLCSAVREKDQWRVTSQPESSLCFQPIRDFWRRQLNTEGWLGEDLFEALTRRFVSSVEIDDIEAFAALRGKGVLFLANHQTGVESLLFSVAASALLDLKVPVFARSTHRDSWIGTLIRPLFDGPDAADPGLLMLVNREDPVEMLAGMKAVFNGLKANDYSLLLHAAGTRHLQARVATEKLSSTLIDSAVANGVPIVPVRFSGGLPLDALDERIAFPIDYSSQKIHLGSPISAESLKELPSPERKKRALAALNGIGEDWRQEQPLPGDPDFEARVAPAIKANPDNPTGVVLTETLREATQPSADTLRLLDVLGGKGTLGDSERDQWLQSLVTRLGAGVRV